MKKLTVKQVLFLLVILLLILPALQRHFNLVAEKPLSGAFVKQEPPNFNEITVSSWMDGSFHLFCAAFININLQSSQIQLVKFKNLLNLGALVVLASKLSIYS